MATEIPIPSPVRPFFSVKVTLDGVAFEVRLRWNERGACWFFSLYDGAEQALAPGRRLVLDFPLLARFVRGRRRLPAGQFVALDTSGAGREAALDDLGNRVLLLYIPAAELPQ